METIGHLIFIFFLHWFGDFVLQSRNVAEKKSKSIKHLTIHVFFYVTAFSPMVFSIGFGLNFIYFILLLFSTHWITDFITSKITTYFWGKKNIKAFFTTIGFDQFLHAVQLLILYYIFVL